MNLETWQLVSDLTEKYGVPKVLSDKESLLFKKNLLAKVYGSNLKEVATFEVCVTFDSGGILAYTSYWMNSLRHRPCEEGPAFISHGKIGRMRPLHEYYEYGQLIRKVYPTPEEQGYL
jgi:hypothetical protein